MESAFSTGMTAVEVLGSVDELLDGTGGLVERKTMFRLAFARRLGLASLVLAQMKTRSRLAAPLIALSLAVAGAAFAQSGDQLGKVEFPNSCSPAVQEKLLRGIKMLHSFYYSATQRAFEDVAAEDNSCAIATWGYRVDPDEQSARRAGRLAQGRRSAQAAIEKGRAHRREDRARARLHRGGRGLLRGLREPARARAPGSRARRPTRRSRRSTRTTTRRRSSPRSTSPARRRRPTRPMRRT